MTRKAVVRLGIGTIILVAATWWTLRNVDLAQMMHFIITSDATLLALAVPVILASHLARADRWCVLLRASYPHVTIGRAYSAILVGYAVNVVIPRAGELVRPWVLSRRQQIPLGASISSVVVERTMDVLTLLLGIVAVSIVANDRITAAIPSFTFGRVVMLIVVPVAMLAIGIAVMAYTRMGAWIIDRTVRPFRAGMADRLVGILGTVREGMQALTHPASYARILVDTILIWALWVVPIWLSYHAVSFEHQISFGLADAAILLLIISIGVTIAPTPGALGVYQSFAQGALMILYGAGQNEALAFAMLSWTLNYAMVFVVGALAWLLEMRAGLGWRDLVGSSRNP